MDERIVIIFDGRPLGVNRISELPREGVAGLLIQLAALYTAIAARLCDGSRAAEGCANKKPTAAVNAQRRVPELLGGANSPASTVCRDSAIDDGTLGGRGRPGDEEKTCLTVKETAAKIGISTWTMYHWIESGKLDEARGLRRLGRRRLIDWHVFYNCSQLGEFN